MSLQKIQEKIDLALRYQQAGNLPDAEILYKQVISEDPNNSNALNLLGILYFQNRRYDDAIECFNMSIEINPNAYFYSNLANVYFRKGEIENAINSYNNAKNFEPDNAKIFFGLAQCYKVKNDIDGAIDLYQEAIRLNPSYHSAYVNLGNIWNLKNEFNKAIDCYEKAVEINSNDAEVFNSLGLNYLKINQIDKAIINLQKAISIKPDYDKAYVNLANAYGKIDNFSGGVNCCELALRINPDNYLAYVCLGDLLRSLDKVDDAIYCYKLALKLNPDESNIFLSLGLAYNRKFEFDEAIKSYNKLIELKPESYEAYLNLACVYLDCDIDKAIECGNKALELKPDSAEAYLNLGAAYTYKHDIAKAKDYYKKAIELKPDSADIHYNLATTYLLNKEFDKGWANYEWRLKRKSKNYLRLPNFSKPMWDGSSLENKTIYICYEQGYGDTIQFSRLLRLLSQTAGKIIFTPQNSMIELIKDSNLNVDIVNNIVKDDSLFDTYCYLVSLPYLLKINHDNIPYSDGYLKTNPDKVKKYREKYFNNDKFKIGIKWLGNPDGVQSRKLSLKYFSCLFGIPDIKIYSLQKETGIEELDNLPENIEITDLGSTFDDFSDTAAAIENLDLIICNDTSVAHLAGALGKPVWILLPFAPEWRWCLDSETTPWYNSVRLFRQKRPGDWSEVFERVVMSLNETLNSK